MCASVIQILPHMSEQQAATLKEAVWRLSVVNSLETSNNSAKDGHGKKMSQVNGFWKFYQFVEEKDAKCEAEFISRTTNIK